MWLKEGRYASAGGYVLHGRSAVWRLADQPQRQPGRWRRTARQRAELSTSAISCPTAGLPNTGKITEFVDAYNEANPDAPMIFDYVAVKTSVPWLEIIFYSVMLGSVGMLFMSMYRGGAGGGIMNVGRAKVKDQQGEPAQSDLR